MARRRSKSWYISRLVRANGIVKDEVVNVSGGTGSADSDVAAIAQLRREADSDETQIQEIGSQVRRAQAAIDSDYALFNAKFALLSGLTDSDLSTVAKLRADVDSDSTKVQTLSSTVGNSVTSTQIDSDRNSGHSARVFRINSTSELNTLNQNNGLGTRVGVARVGDIAYIANPFKAYVLTNIYANAGSTYTATGFRVQTGNGTVTRMTFDIIPAGQTAAGNFAVGMQISNRSYARDVRTITAVTSTYLDFTPSDAGYPPGWDNEYVYTLAAAQTTWQKFSFDSEHVAAIIQEAGVGGFDSDQIVAIINENSTSGSVDSDVAAIAALRRDADSDSTRIQAIATQIEGLNVLVDSDLKAISDLRNDLDSESTVIRSLSANQTAATNITQTVYTYTTTGAQTTFSGADDNSQTLSYSVGRIQVYLNGLLLSEGASADYTATNGTSVVLTEASDSEDVLTVVKYLGTPDDVVTNKYIYKVAPAGNHTPFDSEFTGADENGTVLSYTPGKIQVFLNGILLQDSDDYNATDGSSIYLLTAPDSEDVLVVYRYLGTQVNGFDSDQVVAIVNENTGSAGFDSDQVVGIVYENIAEALTTANPHTVKGARFGRRRNGLDSDGTPEYHLKLVGAASIATDSEDDLNDARYFTERKVCRIDYGLGQADICIISYGEPHNQEGTGYYDTHIIKYNFAGHNGGSGAGARSDASWGLRTVNGTWTSAQMSAGSTIGSPPAITVTHDTSNKRFIVKSNGQPFGTYDVEIVSGRYAIDVEWLL